VSQRIGGWLMHFDHFAGRLPVTRSLAIVRFAATA
jgi:hypothetical protein